MKFAVTAAGVASVVPQHAALVTERVFAVDSTGVATPRILDTVVMVDTDR